MIDSSIAYSLAVTIVWSWTKSTLAMFEIGKSDFVQLAIEYKLMLIFNHKKYVLLIPVMCLSNYCDSVGLQQSLA